MDILEDLVLTSAPDPSPSETETATPIAQIPPQVPEPADPTPVDPTPVLTSAEAPTAMSAQTPVPTPTTEEDEARLDYEAAEWTKRLQKARKILEKKKKSELEEWLKKHVSKQ